MVDDWGIKMRLKSSAVMSGFFLFMYPSTGGGGLED